jgi:hypothetical protein
MLLTNVLYKERLDTILITVCQCNMTVSTKFGGASRSRTEVRGFAIRCIATLPTRHIYLKIMHSRLTRYTNRSKLPRCGMSVILQIQMMLSRKNATKALARLPFNQNHRKDIKTTNKPTRKSSSLFHQVQKSG